jgi:3-hydroxyisobutyrate dehydrogenase
VTRVGFVGVGSQGGPIAARIIAAGHPTSIWARRPSALEPFTALGATPAASPAAVAAASDLVGVCVTDDAAVEDVLLGAGGLLEGAIAGTLFVIHSTIHPDTCRRLADAVAVRGSTLIDAPVSGGAPAVASGTLVVMTGGDTADVERARPVLETFGNPVLHLGPLGSGQAAKALNNLLFTAHIATAMALFEAAEAIGIDRGALARSISPSSGRSYAFDVITSHGFSPATLADHAGPLLRKDVTIVADLADQAQALLGLLLDVADHALDQMGHPRLER